MKQPFISDARNLSIDLVKIIAMIMVVCLHTTHDYIEGSSIDLNYVLYNLSVGAIPLFFMVSGYLLLGREIRDKDYSMIKICKILRFVAFFIGIWWIFHSIFYGWNLNVFVKNYLGCFTQRGYFFVFWYFGAMCIIYLLYPFINRLYFNRPRFLFLFILVAIIQNLVFCTNLTGCGEIHLTQTFRIWNWLTYFMLGGILKDIHVNRKILFLILLFSSLGIIYFTHFLYPYLKVSYCEYFYGMPLVILYSVSIFLLCKETKIRNASIIKPLSTVFLPVYAIHWFVEGFLLQYGEWSGLSLWLTTLIISVCISFVLMRLPVVNKIFII